MTEHKAKSFDFTNLTVNFRWVLPIMLGGYFVAYNHDREIQQQQFSDIKNTQQLNFTDLKQTQDKIWNTISKESQRTDGRFAYVYQQCCTGAKSAPTE